MNPVRAHAGLSAIIALSLMYPHMLQAQCKISKRFSDGKIYRICGKKTSLVPFNYTKYDYFVEKSNIKNMSSLIRYTPADPDRETRDEDFLILDYKAMKLYDWICLNSTAFTLDQSGHWEKINPDSSKTKRFRLSRYNHCAIPVKAYAKLPDRWEEFNRFDQERAKLLKKKNHVSK